MNGVFDLVVIGGGVNGAGIARDAAGRGLRVLLCEKGDLAQGTSSRSSKLIHGGLRYLEQLEFRLVREALIEREVLLQLAPHIVRPMRFVLPHGAGQRPAWLIRLGLLLYDNLGGRRRLPGARRLDLRTAAEGAPIRPDYRLAFAYSDCWVDDARLVVLNALDAPRRGAEVLVRTEADSAWREDGLWRVMLRTEDGATRDVRATALINAAGPWVARVLSRITGAGAPRRIRPVKGSHLIVPKLWDGTQGYLLQNDDRRVVFAMPYEDELCLLGTTDVPFEGAPEQAAIDDRERDYLLRAVNRFMVRQLTPADVVGSFSGVRPLYDDHAADPSSVSRGYVLELDNSGTEAPLLSVLGGKITTNRRLAEHALERLSHRLPRMGTAWTGTAPLPGGDMQAADFDGWLIAFRARHPWLPAPLARHYARLYGTRAEALICGAREMGGLGRNFGGLLYEREADFLIRTEWARRAEDILERRTKHALHMTTAQRDAFETWLAQAG